MRDVQQGCFPCMMRGLARDEKGVQSSLVRRELLRLLFRSLYHPQVEDFCLYDKVVIIPYTPVYLINRILRISWHNTVDKRTIHPACLPEPFPETVPEVPQVYILADAFFEFLAVQEDEFARKDYEPFRDIPSEISVPVIEELGEFPRIR